MDGGEAPRCTAGVQGKDPTAVVRLRVSGRREAVVLAVWAALAAVFVVAFLRVGVDLWAGVRGPVIFGGLVLLGVLFNISRARTRTVRPRHFNVLEGAAALWAGVGAGIAAQILGVADGLQVPIGTALAAALVLTGPLFGCAVWLAVRSR